VPDFIDVDDVGYCALCGEMAEHGVWCQCPRCAWDHYLCQRCVAKASWPGGHKGKRMVKICPRLSTLEEKVALELSGIYPYGPRD